MLDRSPLTLLVDQKAAKQNASLINRLSSRRKDRGRLYGSFTPTSTALTSAAGTHSAVAVELLKYRFGQHHLHKSPPTTDLNQTGKNGQPAW